MAEEPGGTDRQVSVNNPFAGRSKQRVAGSGSATSPRWGIVPVDRARLLSVADGVLLWIAAAYWAKALIGAPLAIDFPPMYGAGQALLQGQPLYAVPRFVYPPFAGLLFAPFTLS